VFLIGNTIIDMANGKLKKMISTTTDKSRRGNTVGLHRDF